MTDRFLVIPKTNDFTPQRMDQLQLRHDLARTTDSFSETGLCCNTMKINTKFATAGDVEKQSYCVSLKLQRISDTMECFKK